MSLLFSSVISVSVFMCDFMPTSWLTKFQIW